MLYLHMRPINDYTFVAQAINKTPTSKCIQITNPNKLIEILKTAQQNTIYFGLLNVQSKYPTLIENNIANSYNLAIDALAHYHGFNHQLSENKPIQEQLQFIQQNQGGILKIEFTNQIITQLIQLAL